eukprot:CAMPEP_0197920158 /NCGR_PEP_ID=MMETSP1439-20131203/88466_1 /TAXON_ID=66791 /ORGANISM="Gonyaulax spinifera, Strain CCMP409" /LENGTH=37 /DNA_ID= /DNA_START= /DNA_END= /DNA_ORIENTATION=
MTIWKPCCSTAAPTFWKRSSSAIMRATCSLIKVRASR